MLYGEYNLIIKLIISLPDKIRFLQLETFYRLIRTRDVCNHRNQRKKTDASVPNATYDHVKINSQAEENSGYQDLGNSDYHELGNSDHREQGNSDYLELENSGYLELGEMSKPAVYEKLK